MKIELGEWATVDDAGVAVRNFDGEEVILSWEEIDEILKARKEIAEEKQKQIRQAKK